MLPILDNTQIESILNDRKLEDVAVIKEIENSLKRMRGYVFKIPKIGTPVILNVSGGLDSSILWGMLMEKYKLEVFPIFFRRGHKRTNREEEAITFFSNFFKKKYPKLFHSPFILKVPMPPQEIRWEITERSQELFNIQTGQRKGLPLYSGLLAFNAVEYSYYLESVKNITIRNIFCSFVSSDGISLKYETITALRSIMHTICVLTGDSKWQFTSLAIEKELGHFWDKDVLIKWASEQKYPLDKMFSCISPVNYKIHCGRCSFCKYRKYSFKKSGVYDPTVYKFSSDELLSYS